MNVDYVQEKKVLVCTGGKNLEAYAELLEKHQYAASVELVPLCKSTEIGKTLENYHIVLICVETMRDYIRFVSAEKNFDLLKTIIVADCKALLGGQCRGYKQCRLLYCEEGKCLESVQAILDATLRANVISLDISDLLNACKGANNHCMVREGKFETVVTYLREMELEGIAHKANLINIVGDVNVSEADEICSTIGYENDTLLGIGYERTGRLRVFYLWKSTEV